MAEKEDRVELFKPSPELEERLKKAFEDIQVRPLPTPKRVLSPKCCPHCWMHEPIGASSA